MKKYILTKTTKEWCGITLFQIKATADFGDVKKGDLGGFIEKEENLSQEDNAWVSGNARVYGNAQVSGNAWVSGDAQVSGNAQVYDNAQVYGNARVYGDAWVYGNAWVSGNAWVYGNARVYGKLKLLAGFFFGHRYKEEEIKFEKIDKDYDLIYKGDAKFGEEEDEEIIEKMGRDIS